MNNIFGDGSQNPLGPPQAGGGYDPGDPINRLYPLMVQEKERDRDFQREMMRMRMQPQLAQIAKNSVSQPTQPMNQVVNLPPQMSDFQKATIGLNTQKLGEKINLDTQGLNIKKQGANINQGKLDLATKVASGKATDAEKQQYKLDQIDAQGSNTSDQIAQRGDIQNQQIDTRGSQRMDQINQQGVNAQELQGQKSTDALSGIAANIAGKQDLEGFKIGNKTELPTQTYRRTKNTATEVMNTRPDLAKFIVNNPDGSVGITPPSEGLFGHSGPTQDQFDEINKLIYGDSSDNSSKKTAAPKSPKAPVVNVPQSKYKVTVK